VVWIRVRNGGASTVFTLGGGSGLAHALQVAGIPAISLERLSTEQLLHLTGLDQPAARPLLLGWTRDYGYKLATTVLRLAKCISEIYTASDDRCYPDETGAMPGVRWLSASVGALLEKEPLNPAKPSPYALEYVLRKLQQPASRTVLIGDSRTDIQSGNQAGCRTVLLLGGVTAAGEVAGLEGIEQPSLVINELTDLL
jgi:ribonucleotide monophosphatase NagD (HAD superfamily)